MITKSILLQGYSDAQISYAMLEHTSKLKGRKGDYAKVYTDLTLMNTKEAIKNSW